jgi:hypothetical protein
MSSTVNDGYQKQLQDKGITNLDFANLHVKAEAIQSPFTLAHVGGQQARSVPPMATPTAPENKRKESYKLDLVVGGGSFDTHKVDSTPKGQYVEVRAHRDLSILRI